MRSGVFTYFPIIVSVIIGIMFGWEIGFGVAFIVGGITFFTVNQPLWGTICLLLGCILAIDSLWRTLTVVFNVSYLEVSYFVREDKSIFPKSHEYGFSGEIEIKVTSPTAIRKIYLVLPFGNAELMYDLSDELNTGATISPSKPILKRVTFKFWSETSITELPKIADLILKTTEWDRKKSVKLVFRENT